MAKQLLDKESVQHHSHHAGYYKEMPSEKVGQALRILLDRVGVNPLELTIEVSQRTFPQEITEQRISGIYKGIAYVTEVTLEAYR